MRLLSLEGKLVAAMAFAAAAAAALTAALIGWLQTPWIAAAAAFGAVLPVAMLTARLMARPLVELIRALSGSVVAFRDGDFSFSIADRRRDEMGDLVVAHNQLGQVLREQRRGLVERELMLDTLVQHSPTAMVLIESGGHVVHANLAARALLNHGRALNGERFDAIVAEAPEQLGAALADREDRLFSAEIDGEEETFHLSQRDFKLQGRAHRMVMLRRMTRELSRQEVATWKKVIRVISHEINNSLAPISSLSHSGRELARRGDVARLATVFETIEDRTRHLEAFIQGYARFARLPQPQPQAVAWAPLLDALSAQYAFTPAGPPPAEPGWFDRTQIEQVLINLLKNAHEAGGPPDGVELAVSRTGRDLRIDVRDRGPGMSETVLAHALLPFYSTKRSGTGLGLSLAREIAEAHGGRVQLANRADGGLEVSLLLPQPA